MFVVVVVAYKEFFFLEDFSESSWLHKNNRLRFTVLILLPPFSV